MLKHYLLFVVALIFTTGVNAACICTNTPELQQAIKDASNIVKGRVEQIIWLSPFDYLVKIHVHASWKTVQNKYIWLGSTTIEKECGFQFTTGHEYLIYSYNVTPHFLAASQCGRTQEWQAVSDQEKILLGDIIYINEDY